MILEFFSKSQAHFVFCQPLPHSTLSMSLSTKNKAKHLVMLEELIWLFCFYNSKKSFWNKDFFTFYLFMCNCRLGDRCCFLVTILIWSLLAFLYCIYKRGHQKQQNFLAPKVAISFIKELQSLKFSNWIITHFNKSSI